MKVNETAFKPEYMFIMYDDVVRTSMMSFINELINRKSSYDEFIDFDAIINKPQHEIIKLIQNRISYNILISLAKKNKDFDETLSYLSISSGISKPYEYSPDMVMTLALPKIISQKFEKKIYIYHPYDDSLIKEDIKSICKDIRNIEFIHGDIETAINKIPEKITLYVVNDIHAASKIIDVSPNQYADILVANYGYNYKLSKVKGIHRPVLCIDNIEEKCKTNNYRLRMFMPFMRELLEPATKVQR
jgi:hypothetical protein